MAPQFQQKTSLIGSLLQGFGGTASQLGSFSLGEGWNGNGLGQSDYASLFGNNYNYGYTPAWNGAAGYRSW